MNQSIVTHLEFWTQFRQYSANRNIDIRLSKPANRASTNVILPRRYFRLRPWRVLRNHRVGVSVDFEQGPGTKRFREMTQEHHRHVNERLAPFGSTDWQPSSVSLSRGCMMPLEADEDERYSWLANAIETTRLSFDEICPPSPPLNLRFHGEKVLNFDSGDQYDVLSVAARLPWQVQKGANSTWQDYPPYMPPHEYVVIGKCEYAEWDVLYFACTGHPASYLGYFRGYQNAMRYWEPGDGYRYWPTAQHGVMMLNRCLLSSVEPPRRKDHGAKPIKPKDWGAPPWLPQGNGWPRSYLEKHPKLARELLSNASAERDGHVSES